MLECALHQVDGNEHVLIKPDTCHLIKKKIASTAGMSFYFLLRHLQERLAGCWWLFLSLVSHLGKAQDSMSATRTPADTLVPTTLESRGTQLKKMFKSVCRLRLDHLGLVQSAVRDGRRVRRSRKCHLHGLCSTDILLASVPPLPMQYQTLKKAGTPPVPLRESQGRTDILERMCCQKRDQVYLSDGRPASQQ